VHNITLYYHLKRTIIEKKLIWKDLTVDSALYIKKVMFRETFWIKSWSILSKEEEKIMSRVVVC
jgi:hypothetical protein